MKKQIAGLIGGLIPVVILWAYVKLIAIKQDPQGYGLAILPLIIISIILFMVGWYVGKKLNSKKKMGKITKKEQKSLLLTVGTFVFIFGISKIIGDFSTILLAVIGGLIVLYTLWRY